MVLWDNGKIVIEDETEENEMPTLEDVGDEEYIAPGELTLVVRRALSVQEYEDLFSKETPHGLPQIRGIKHQIHFVLGALIPNRPAYRSNSEETKELKSQDGTWRMCVECRAINNMTVKYRHPIPRYVLMSTLNAKLLGFEHIKELYAHDHDFSVEYQACEKTVVDPKPPVHPIRSCLMFSSHSYEESFPPLEKQTDTQTRVTSKPFVQPPITASGQPEEPKQYEAVLNWQTKNANAQNHTLQQLGKKIDRVATQVSQTETKVDSISSRLDQMYIHLQDRISELDTDLRRMINNHIWGPEFNKKEAEIRKLKAELSRIDVEKTRPSLFTQPQPTPVSPPIFETYNQSSDSSEPETVDESNPSESNPSSSNSSENTDETSTDSESEYADITGILMATETADPSASTSTPIVDDNPSDQASQTDPVPPPVHEHSTKPSSASWFTFDDIPRHKWAARLQEFAAWIYLQGTKPHAQPQAILREFMASSTGSLRDWLESLGEYRQLQFMESLIGTALNLIHEQFIGEKITSTEADRKEYHKMKCCSLKRHLLDAHYKRMSILFYKLNGFNEPSLKHVFIASLPSELQLDLQRKLTATNLSIVDISLGKNFQMAMLSLGKICEQKAFFKDLMEDKKPFSEASVRLIQHLQHSSLLSENEDVESNFSEQSAQDDQTAFLIAESSDSDDIFVISTVQTVNHVSTIPRPSLKMSIIPSKYHKLVPVIGFIDTGADTSMIDPSVLPSDYWEHHSKLFRAVNGETFETTLITKKPVDTLRLYALSETSSPYSHISQKFLEFCPENHSQFHHPSPLWKNEQFFIHLPFKLNEDINPTKASHPEAVKQLKVIAQSPPPLRIPASGQRILQTDASDDYWSAILLEDINGVRHFCAHASRQFKDSEKNYHVIYKEILAVKYGIKKFKFHLISHKFFINMDNSSFPRIFDFKNKLLPDKQLLSLKTWFAKYDFTVQHIKGNQNLIPYFLTRPAINKPALISSIQTIPVIAMNRQLPFKALNQRNFPMNISFQSAYQLQDFAKKFLYRFFFNVQTKKPDRFPNLCMEHLFLTGLTLSSLSISKDELWYMWCLTTLTYPHPYTLIHDTSVSSVLKAYLMELNNVPPPAINIHHTSIGPSHTLEVIPKTQGCTPGSSSSPQGILVMEQRPDYTNVLFQDAQDPWEDFQSLLHTENPDYTVTTPASPAASTSQPMTEADEDKYQQAEAYLDQRQIRRHKRQYEKDTRDVSPSRYPSTP
ncbi:hypothetical protein KPL71_021566 [Citrus sinensis]|uniref:Uncharacterized protein n=1 Tax=Citrus sinensis TaxID=2711 RepID=A0ACB8JGQ2_CITSI|nr:hypothetical protein KPL71_021566 [Citrus sinensis]